MIDRIQQFDDKILDNIPRLHRPLLNKFMRVATHLGTGGVIWFAIAIPFFFAPRGRIIGTNMIMGLSITHVLGEILIKHIVCRERPCHKIKDEAQIIEKPKYYSFPSGHTASSFCMVAVAIMRCEWYIWIPILMLASLIAFSRIYLRVHYLTDVLVGAVIGLICGRASVSLVNYVYYNLTYEIMKKADPTKTAGMLMSVEHMVTELIVLSAIILLGVIFLYIFHRRKK